MQTAANAASTKHSLVPSAVPETRTRQSAHLTHSFERQMHRVPYLFGLTSSTELLQVDVLFAFNY